MIQHSTQICCHCERSSVLITPWCIHMFCEYLIIVHKLKQNHALARRAKPRQALTPHRRLLATTGTESATNWDKTSLHPSRWRYQKHNELKTLCKLLPSTVIYSQLWNNVILKFIISTKPKNKVVDIFIKTSSPTLWRSLRRITT